jgi:ABC-type Mn2+/Zn2+ transport system permease subunit
MDTTMINILLEPLKYAFMQRGFIASILVGIVCAVIGCYVVLRGLAFLGDALAHAVLPGVAIAYLLGGSLLGGALIAALLVALGITIFSNEGSIKEDTAIGILFSASLALGVALISSIRTYAVDLSHILFGNVLGVSSGDVWVIFGLTVVVLGVLLALYRPFLVVSFDPVLATTLRLPTTLLRGLMLVLLALTIVISLQTVGIGLVTALLVTPGAAAYLLTRRLPAMMGLAALFGALSSLVGLYLSYYLNIASGAAVVLVATLLFVLVYLFAPQRGVVTQWLRSRKGRLETAR